MQQIALQLLLISFFPPSRNFLEVDAHFMRQPPRGEEMPKRPLGPSPPVHGQLAVSLSDLLRFCHNDNPLGVKESVAGINSKFFGGCRRDQIYPVRTHEIFVFGNVAIEFSASRFYENFLPHRQERQVSENHLFIVPINNCISVSSGSGRC